MRVVNCKRLSRDLIFIICILQYSFLLSCGYTVHRTSALPVKSVRISGVENHTFEPGLQDLLINIFTEELLRSGISSSETSKYVFSAVLTDYKLDTMSIKNDLSVEYSIRIVANITLRLPDGTTRRMKGISSEFMETFVSADNIQAIQAQREVATKKAVRDLSQRIIAEMIYNTNLE
jgi:hypothetical protein